MLPTRIPVLPVVRNLAVARRGDRLPARQVTAVQDERLRRLVRHALTQVPYYRERADPGLAHRFDGAEQLRVLPVLDRTEVTRLGPDPFTADGFSAANTQEATTSGSTGRPVTLRYSEQDMDYLRATFLWDMLASGMRPWDRIGYFRMGEFRHHWLESLGLARNVHVNTTHSVQRQGEAFLRGRPTFLWGYPGAILTLTEEFRRRGIDYSAVRGVLFAGESMSTSARSQALGYLGARGHEAYACVEAYTIARSCRRGALHLRLADVAVEVEDDLGETRVVDHTLSSQGLEGDILVTRLVAQAMPLLRYRLGDRVAIGPDDCGCDERHSPILHVIKGRSTDRVTTMSGRVRSADFLFHLAKEVPGVRQTQFVQETPGAIEVRVVPGPGVDPAGLVGRMEVAMAPAGEDVKLRVSVVEALEPEANGKYKLVRGMS